MTSVDLGQLGIPHCSSLARVALMLVPKLFPPLFPIESPSSSLRVRRSRHFSLSLYIFTVYAPEPRSTAYLPRPNHVTLLSHTEVTKRDEL